MVWQIVENIHQNFDGQSFQFREWWGCFFVHCLHSFVWSRLQFLLGFGRFVHHYFFLFAWSSLHSFKFFQKVFSSLIGVVRGNSRVESCLLLRYQRCKNWKASLCSNIQFFDKFLYVWGKLNRSNAVCERASRASTPCTAHYLKEETANVLVLFWANE